MSLTFEFFNTIGRHERWNYAHQIAAESQPKNGSTPDVVPLSPRDVFRKQIGVVAFDGGRFAGYAGALEPEEHNGFLMTKVGSLMVPVVYRGQGIAGELVHMVSDATVERGQLPYAFCNEASFGAFGQNGYEHVSVDHLPTRALGARAVYPMLYKLPLESPSMLVHSQKAAA